MSTRRLVSKEGSCLGWQFAQPLPLNTGSPGHLADNILVISGVVYPYHQSMKEMPLERFYSNGSANSYIKPVSLFNHDKEFTSSVYFNIFQVVYFPK